MNSHNTISTDFNIIIIGSGIAGLSSIKAIRKKNSTATICLINGEDRYPYKRTKISKFLHSGFEKNQFSLIDENYLNTNSITMIENRVSTINTSDKSLVLQDGKKLKYNTCIIAIGTEARKHNVFDSIADDIFYVRNASQVEKLHKKLRTSDKITILGGGVLGVEIASQVSLMSKNATLMSRSNRLMYNELTPYASNHLHNLLVSNNINILPETNINLVSKKNDTFNIDTDKGIVESDCIIACIGSQPNTSLKINTKTLDTITIDNNLHTGYDGLFAAGDCTNFSGNNATHLWHASEAEGYHAGLNVMQYLTGNDLQPFIHKPFRLKCEVFDTFYFSMNYHDSDGSLTGEEHCNDIYKYFQYKDNNLAGIVMIGDKPRAKEYEKALREKWPKDKVDQVFN